MNGELLSIQKFILAQKVVLTPEEKLRESIDNQVTAVDVDLAPGFETFLKSSAAYQFTPSKTPGYFVFSTAPFNTEDGAADLILDLTPAMKDWEGNELNQPQKAKTATGFFGKLAQLTTLLTQNKRELKLPMRKPQPPEVRRRQFKAAIQSIADDLCHIPENITPELIITIHGYSTEQTSVRRWYKKIYQYVNRDPALKDRNNLVFLGYRWSSEQVSVGLESLIMAVQALPLLPRFIVGGGLLLSLFFLAKIAQVVSPSLDLLIALLLAIAAALTATVFSLVVLRLIVYFRDNYRASNFAVLDLVELIRLLDEELQRREFNRNNRRINLSFIGHSMGGFVVTNVVRILSDVFDQKAVEKRPDSGVGKVFCLQRLVLASPDIPVLAIAASRANFLASSLRRFDEAYLFSNEGDLALRLASTAANYFSFPARTRESGYRLGNVTVLPGKSYGIVNKENLKRYCSPLGEIRFESIQQSDTALDSLFVSNINGGVPDSIAELANRRLNTPIDRFTIADLFTYFDCTDYIEVADGDAFDRFLQDNKQYKRFIRKFRALPGNMQALGVLSRALGVRPTPKQRSLSIIDYARLIFDFIKGRDVHGGYFAAPFSQKLIYQLAFLGLQELLATYNLSQPDAALEQLDRDCRNYWLQVLLSPLHYSKVYVTDEQFRAIKAQMVEHIAEADRTA